MSSGSRVGPPRDQIRCGAQPVIDNVLSIVCAEGSRCCWPPPLLTGRALGWSPMLNEIRDKLEGEIESLVHELNVELPERLSSAVELGDLRENAEYKSALERQQFIQARIGHLSQRLSELSKIDVEAMPSNRIGFGSRVTIVDLELSEEIRLTLVAGDFMDLDAGHVSLESPIGRGLIGAQQGEDVVIQLPRGERRFKVKVVETLPQQLGLVD